MLTGKPNTRSTGRWSVQGAKGKVLVDEKPHSGWNPNTLVARVHCFKYHHLYPVSYCTTTGDQSVAII